MLRRLFRRRPPLGSIDDSLARFQDADTPQKRAAEIAQLRDLLAVFHDAAGDAAQRGLLAMEDRLSGRFSGLVQTQLGVTNDMISDLSAGIGGLQRQLGDMFSSLGERLDDHDLELKQLHQGQQLIKAEISDLNQRHGGQIGRIEQRLAGALIASSEEEAQQFRALLQDLLRERAAGGGG